MRTTKSAVAVGLVLLIGLVGALLMSSPTQAEPKKLKVSSSEAGPWGDNLTRPLFENLGPFVPMDSVPDRFFVKNNSNQPARATLAVIDRGAGNEFEQLLSFTASVGGETTEIPAFVDSKKKCKTYVTGDSIAPGAVQPVDVTLNFADTDGQVAMDQTASVEFVLTLSQVGPKGKVDICGVQAVAEPYELCSQPRSAVVNVLGRSSCAQVKGVAAFADPGAGSGPDGVAAGTLAGTGAPRDVATLLGIATVLLGSGALLLVVRRRRPGPRSV